MDNVFAVFDGSTALEVFDPKEFNLWNVENEDTYYSIREQAIQELQKSGKGDLNKTMEQIFARDYADDYARQSADLYAYYLNRERAIQEWKERGQDDPNETEIDERAIFYGSHHVQQMKKRRTLREYEEDYQNEEI